MVIQTIKNQATSKVVEYKLPCPHCTSSDAYHLYDDGHGYCFSCQAFDPPKRESYLSNEFTYEYLPDRGIRADTYRFYEIKTKIDQNGKPVARGYKYPNGSYKVRKLQDKEFYVEKNLQGEGLVGLFGRDKFTSGSHDCITITEGEEDAASLYQVLHSPVVSVQSAATALRDCSVDRAFLNGFKRVYLAFDGDRPGLDAAASVAKLFDNDKVYHVRFDRPDRKDANAYLQHNETDELLTVWKNSKKFVPPNIVYLFEDFEKILAEKPRAGVPYPFPTLNHMLCGMRKGETVLLTAKEGVGKTQLMHAFEYQLLKETPHEVGIGAIFIEEPKQRHLQEIAGLELGKPVHLPDIAYSEDEVIAALKKAVQKDERLHIYSHFGSDDPEVFLDTIRYLVSARSCDFILLDHISMVVSGRTESDERRALDYLSTKLEMMVKELDFGLLLVSHVNDDGETRGSRYIGKVADIRVDLSRDLLNPDPAIRNQLNLMVSKNRPIGRTGPAGVLQFNSDTHSYSEALSFVNDNQPITERNVA